MSKVVNTTTNGIIDSTVISNIIDEVNRINDWLNELGYERPNQGMLYTYERGIGQVKAKSDVKGADDFKVFTAKIGDKLKPNNLVHNDITIKSPPGHTWKNMTATVECKDLLVACHIKSISTDEAIIGIRTFTKPTTAQTIRLHLIAVAVQNDDDTD